MRLNVYIFSLLMLIISCKDNSTKSLSDHEWEVISVNNTELSGTLPILRFDLEKGKVNGDASCNNFFGSVEIINSSIKFEEIGSTKMMCADMTNEVLLFTNLKKVSHYTFDSNYLLLYSENDSVGLKLKPKTSTK